MTKKRNVLFKNLCVYADDYERFSYIARFCCTSKAEAFKFLLEYIGVTDNVSYNNPFININKENFQQFLNEMKNYEDK